MSAFGALRQLASLRQWYLSAALGLYVVVVGFLLVWSQFLPYGSDNNESFSAFTHARNLLHFGVGPSRGLTDEAYSGSPAAHPYVYTHEGNFPRLPVYAMMRLGLTGIEWQMALLALVVGSATIYLCFTFLSRAVGDLFAFLVCAVLTTDYLLFMQWEINTFRVWHGFFFFACLLCVQSLGQGRPRRVGVSLFLTCVGLFYFEIVFAIFTVAASLCYGLLIYWKRRELVYRGVLIAGAGAMVALAGLVGQSVAYLGWTTAWRDIQLTFLNRNFYVQAGVQRAALQTLQFFLQHHIVYWRDNPDTSGYLRITSFLRNFGKFGLLVQTPYLLLLMWTVTIAWLAHRLTGRGIFILDRTVPDPKPIPLNRIGLVAFLLCVAAVYELNHLRLYGADFASLWHGAIEGYFQRGLLVAVFIAALSLGVMLVQAVGPQFFPPDDARRIGEVLRYLVAAIAGYTFLYVVSPGYLWAGYLVRYVPLVVFIVDVWIALFFYLLILIVKASHFHLVSRVQGSASRGRFFEAAIIPQLMGGLALFLLMFAVAYWARIQTVYAEAVPLSDYGFMRQLAQEPYRGATFISDTYAAPIAYFTGTWAYADDLVSENLYVEDSGKVSQVISGDKLWEADRDTNTRYLHPQYYICIRTPTLYTGASFVLLRPGERLSQCSGEPLVRTARENVGPFHNVLVAADTGPWDMWAIVKLDPSIHFAFAGPVFELRKQQQDDDILQARRLTQAVKAYHRLHGCYPSVSARSFGAMPRGLEPHVGGAWPRLQMYGAFDHGWHWVGSGGSVSFVGVIPYSVWQAAPREFVSAVNDPKAKMC